MLWYPVGPACTLLSYQGSQASASLYKPWPYSTAATRLCPLGPHTTQPSGRIGYSLPRSPLPAKLSTSTRPPFSWKALLQITQQRRTGGWKHSPCGDIINVSELCKILTGYGSQSSPEFVSGEWAHQVKLLLLTRLWMRPTYVPSPSQRQPSLAVMDKICLLSICGVTTPENKATARPGAWVPSDISSLPSGRKGQVLAGWLHETQTQIALTSSFTCSFPWL